MVETFVDGVKEASSTTIEKELIIPQIMMCSNDKFCRVIQINYKIEVEAKVPGCHGNIEMPFEITIGTVPLRFGQTYTNGTHSPPYENNFVNPIPIPVPAPYDNNFTIASAPMPELRKFLLNLQY